MKDLENAIHLMNGIFLSPLLATPLLATALLHLVIELFLSVAE